MAHRYYAFTLTNWMVNGIMFLAGVAAVVIVVIVGKIIEFKQGLPTLFLSTSNQVQVPNVVELLYVVGALAPPSNERNTEISFDQGEKIIFSAAPFVFIGIEWERRGNKIKLLHASDKEIKRMILTGAAKNLK